MTKTTKDMVYALIDVIAGDSECAQRIRAKSRKTLAKLKDDARWKILLSEKEFAGMKELIETDLPAFLRRLERIGRAPAASAGK